MTRTTFCANCLFVRQAESKDVPGELDPEKCMGCNSQRIFCIPGRDRAEQIARRLVEELELGGDQEAYGYTRALYNVSVDATVIIREELARDAG